MSPGVAGQRGRLAAGRVVLASLVSFQCPIRSLSAWTPRRPLARSEAPASRSFGPEAVSAAMSAVVVVWRVSQGGVGTESPQ